MSHPRFGRIVALMICGAMFLAPASARADADWRWPVSGPVALEYGARYTDAQGQSCSHGGVDIRSEAGAEVRAAAAGDVVFAGLVPAGEGARVWAVTVLTAEELRVTYMPLAGAAVARGASVAAGDPLGSLSSAGDASTQAAHLHLGVRRGERSLDPLSFLGPAVAASAPSPAPGVAPPAPVRPPDAPVRRQPTPAGSPVAAHVPVTVVTGRSVAGEAAMSVPRPSPLTAPGATAPGLDLQHRIPPVADNTRVRTSAISADVEALRGSVAGLLIRLVAVGIAGACAWPVLRGVFGSHRDGVPAAVSVRRVRA